MKLKRFKHYWNVENIVMILLLVNLLLAGFLLLKFNGLKIEFANQNRYYHDLKNNLAEARKTIESNESLLMRIQSQVFRLRGNTGDEGENKDEG